MPHPPTPAVKDIFMTMAYGPAPENDTEAQQWLKAHQRRFGPFINGTFGTPARGFATTNPATGKRLATLSRATQADVNAAVCAARSAAPSWAALSGHARARHLYALARLIQKHARLFAVLETLDNGKPIRESRDIDIPLAHRHFYYHAGMAQLMPSTLPDRQPIGVCGQIIPWNFPLLMLAWKVAPALATGNTVVLKPSEETSLTALLFAEICQQAALPAGVLNIITGPGAVGESLITHKGIDKIAFTGSTAVGRRIRALSAGAGKALTLELGGKSPYIVFEDADLDSAIEGLVDAIWFNQGEVCCAGSRLLVQESIAAAFEHRLRQRMNRLRTGNPLDKCIDVGALISARQLQKITALVDSCDAGSVFHAACALPARGYFYPPTLISGVPPSHPLMHEEIFGPVLVSTTFRTPAEAIALANNTRYGLAASVWSENINLALDTAQRLAAGVVWVNASNLFDAAAGFGGIRESGFGREGGWEGLKAYTKPADARVAQVAQVMPIARPAKTRPQAARALDRTAKLYIGGRQQRPDGGYSRAIYGADGALLGHVPVANRKDIRNAVEAARAGAQWAALSGHARAQVLYYIAENLSARAAEFAQCLDRMTGGSGGAREVEAAIEVIFTYAAWADKFDGQVHETPMRGMALAVREPVGIIGAFCADEVPLLGLVGAMMPALAMGNRVVLLASTPYPLAAVEFYQVLDTSDLPAGSVALLTGCHRALAAVLAGHRDVDAVWHFSRADIGKRIETASASNLKRTWVDRAALTDWYRPCARDFLEAASEVKNIWIPYGE
ncbi:MAG: aldehyde dehydrogenase family protein [Rhodobacteraceae bacterium]|nr:aldehyde dehydrogenase family protein [Paracoccaceae bacterium]